MSYVPMKLIYGEVHMYRIVCVMYNTYLMMICPVVPVMYFVGPIGRLR